MSSSSSTASTVLSSPSNNNPIPLTSLSTSSMISSPPSSNPKKNKNNPIEKTFKIIHASKQFVVKNSKDGQVCPNCQHPYAVEEFLIRLRCGHIYHLDCSHKAATTTYSKNECGACRQSLHPTITPSSILDPDLNDEETKEYDRLIDLVALYYKAHYRENIAMNRKRKRLEEEELNLSKRLDRIKKQKEEAMNITLYGKLYEVPNRVILPSDGNVHIDLSEEYAVFPFESDDEDDERYVHNDRYDRNQRAEYVPNRRTSS